MFAKLYDNDDEYVLLTFLYFCHDEPSLL